MNDKLLALYGLAFNPFSPDVPTEALHLTPPVESFFWKVQQGLLREGGFALITGEPGTGKSVTLRLLSRRLAQEPELVVGVISRPQASVADFYREMETIAGKAQALGSYELFKGGWAGLFRAAERYETITAADLQRVAASYFRPENRTVVTLIPTSGGAEDES